MTKMELTEIDEILEGRGPFSRGQWCSKTRSVPCMQVVTLGCVQIEVRAHVCGRTLNHGNDRGGEGCEASKVACNDDGESARDPTIEWDDRSESAGKPTIEWDDQLNPRANQRSSGTSASSNQTVHQASSSSAADKSTSAAEDERRLRWTHRRAARDSQRRTTQRKTKRDVNR